MGKEVPTLQTMEEVRALFTDPLVCPGCRPQHHSAWSASYLACSIQNAGFQALYLKYLDFLKQEQTRKDLGREPNAEDLRQCLFCHAPQVQFASDAVVRQISDAIAAGRWDEIRGAQINCVVCHAITPQGKWSSESFQRSGTLYGPLRDPAPQAMHKSGYSPLHTKSELCGICHSLGTFNVYCSLVYEQQKEADPAGRTTCQDCHMKGREKVPVAVAGKANRTLHDHTFPGGRFVGMWAEALDVDLGAERKGEGELLVTVTLRSKVSHNIPDG